MGSGAKAFTCRLLSQVYMMVAWGWGGDSQGPPLPYSGEAAVPQSYMTILSSLLFTCQGDNEQSTLSGSEMLMRQISLPHLGPTPAFEWWGCGVFRRQRRPPTPCRCLLSTATDPHKCKCFVHFLLRSTTDPTIIFPLTQKRSAV